LKLERPIQILVRRRAALGDTIMSTGVVRELKLQYDCEIDVATEFLEVYKNNPHIRNIYHTSNMPEAGNYDLYINLDDAYEYNPTTHYVDNYFYRAFGSIDRNKSVELFPDEYDLKYVNEFRTKHNLEKYIVIHIRQWYWPLKNLSINTWLEILIKLFTHTVDIKIVCVGSPMDGFIDHPLIVDGRGNLNVQQSKLLLDDAVCFVGTDSGPMHIAGASRTHIIALQTHLLPERILPYRVHFDRPGHNCTAVLSSVECVGCNDRQQRPVRQVECEPGDYRCVNNFDAEKIAKNIIGLL
jgi:ADP-heptose:LPS heptosyltransferase